MLVLSRREGDRVVFPELGIELVVNRIRGNTISVGIDAPNEVRVLRGELCFEPGARDQVRKPIDAKTRADNSALQSPLVAAAATQ